MAKAITSQVIGDQAVVGLLVRTTQNANNASPAFRRFAQKFRGHLIKQFATEGAHFGTPWQPLSPQYAAWKMRKYGPKKILQREGELRDSLMRRALSVMTVTDSELVIGTDVPHAVYHQEGRGVPKRPIIVASPEVVRDAREILANYIVDGGAAVQVVGEEA